MLFQWRNREREKRKFISVHLIALLPLPAALEVSQLFATFCGEIGELERDREQDCKKTFSDVFRSVFMRRAPLSDGESWLLFSFGLEVLIALRSRGCIGFVSLITTDFALIQ